MSIISTKYLLQDAQANGYAVPAFNIHNAETIQAILEVCSEMRSPVILAGTPGTFKHIALEEIYAPDEAGGDPELEAAAALVEGRYRGKLAAGRKDLVVAALARRGFAYPIIKEAIKRVEEEN